MQQYLGMSKADYITYVEYKTFFKKLVMIILGQLCANIKMNSLPYHFGTAALPVAGLCPN